MDKSVKSPDSKDHLKNPFVFNMRGPVEFAEEGEEKNKVQLTLYDGSIVKHWYWGNLAFDLSTMKMAKKGRNPILFSHDVNQRLAYSTKATFDQKFVLEGMFLESSEKAQEVKKEMVEGFPFEASLSFDPDKSKIEHIREGESTEVNGHTLKGPGTVISNAVIAEGSICVFGALKNTVSDAFEIENRNLIEGENLMAEKKDQVKLTAETFAAEYPELSEQVTAAAEADGEKAAMERFEQIRGLAKDDPAFVVEQFAAGKSVVEAQTALIERLRSQKDEAVEAAKTSAKKVDPAGQEFSDEQNPADKNKDKDGKPTTWDAAMKQQMTETKCSEADAVRFCVREYPELHAKMLEGQKK